MRDYSLLDNVPHGCCVIDSTGRIVFWNHVLETWTGRSRAEMLGADIYARYPTLATPRFRPRFETTLDHGLPSFLSATLTPPFFERRERTVARRYEQVTLTRTTERHAKQAHVLMTIVDHTEQFERSRKYKEASARANAESEARRAREAELVLAKEAADAANGAKSLFLAAMSHELRTPMNGVLGMADLLLHSDLSPWHRDHLEILQSSASSLLTVLNDILDFSKIEANKLELEAIAYDPRSVVEESVVLVAELTHAKGVECSAIVEPNVPFRVIGDPTRLRQVLMNLLSNAAKFTSRGQITVRLSAEQEAGAVRLRVGVEDSGGGIPPETAAKLFEPFTQASAAVSRTHGGTGLGLSICRRLVRMMGGEIGVASAVGRGSTFYFDVLVVRAENDSLASCLTLDPSQSPSELSVAVALTHGESAEALVRQLEAIGVPARRVAPTELAGWLEGGRPTHVFVDPSASIRELYPLLGGARLLVCTRPADARVAPPAGVAAFLATPCRLSVVAESLGIGKKPDRPAPAKLALRVLVADDESTNRLVARAMLKSMGCTVDVVEDGAAAVEAATSTAYDIVFLDMQMPNLSGCEAAAFLRTVGYQGTILALTASVLEEERRACVQAGMNEVVSKPLDRRVLHTTISKYAPPTARKAA